MALITIMTIHFDDNILSVDLICGTFKVRRCKDFRGQISMETESQRAVCRAVVGGGLFYYCVEDGAWQLARGGMCKQMLPVSWEPGVK